MNNKKVFMLGLDAMDPRFTKYMLDAGKMPNVQKLIENGSAREDLVLLGGHPTVTPPMWATLSTGCYANVHGITDFYAPGTEIDSYRYGLDSRLCKAEHLWDVLAEAGKKTLVWHWPGGGWPPTSDSPNLTVVDGTSPGVVGVGVGCREAEFILGASVDFQNVTYIKKASDTAAVACMITGLDAEALDNTNSLGNVEVNMSKREGEFKNLIIDHDNEGTYGNMTNAKNDVVQSPIKDAQGWINAPENAKEMTLLLSGGLIRRPCLILQNQEGIYDRIAVYKSKKETEPIVVLPAGEIVYDIIDDCIAGDEHFNVNRSMRVLELAPDGTRARVWVSTAMDLEATRHIVHPHELYDELVEKFGYPPASSLFGLHEKEEIIDCQIGQWKRCGDWQADCLNYLMEDGKNEFVFSHYHIIDIVAHQVIQGMADKGKNKYDESVYLGYMEALYIEADRYIGRFLHLLDKGWTILLVSDHGQVCSEYEMLAYGDPNGCSIGVLEELGLTVVKRDENGNKLHEIDWEHTYAVNQRGPHIYLNLKSRSEHGIIEPEDQYEWEEEIITRLYGYRSKKTGKRVFSVAVRNKDAIHFGLGGPESGDIICFANEGYSFDHGDTFSTAHGSKNTSVSPLFIACGNGIKKGFTTERVIRQVDVAPTMALLAGVRMPANCEGAPIYQIFDEKEITLMNY